MSKTTIYFTVIIIVLIIIILAVVAYLVSLNNSATSSTTTLNTEQVAPTDTVQISSNIVSGSFLADANGKTLYYFANDKAGISNCTGQCSKIWPPFYSANIVVPSDLNVSDFGQIINSDGESQTTYMGRPLYYYSGDKNPGDTKGDGVNKLWHLVKP